MEAGESLEIQNEVAEIKIRAERRAGELLKEMKETGERHTGHGDQKSESYTSTPKLTDMGISRDQSSRWQTIAGIPEQDFEDKIEETKQAGR